jgi:hypothetical protein
MSFNQLRRFVNSNDFSVVNNCNPVAYSFRWILPARYANLPALTP